MEVNNMIKAILGKGFKGLEFNQPLGQFNLFLGPNGAGKSSRTQALILAIMGYLPSDGKKKPGDIFDIHSESGKPFTVGFVYTPPGTNLTSTFSRTFKRSNEGVVTQDVAANKLKLKREQIDKVLFQHGDPKIFDLPGFMDLSDQKKIDLIFTLFPPEADLSGIDEKLEVLSGEEKTITAELKSISLVIERMTKERSEIVLPAGTMAEIKANIAEKEQQLAETEEAIKEIEAQERADKAKADAEAKAKKEAERIKAKAEADAVEAQKKADQEKQRAVESAKQQGREEAKAEAKIEAPPAKKEAEPIKINTNPDGFVPGDFTQVNAVTVYKDIERILATMQASKCPQCAAIIVAKMLIKKYQGKEAA
jgi:hypothetical protein